jgi:hypothetical protein
MRKPKKGKPRRPRGPRKKSNRRSRKSVAQHVLFAKRWCRNYGVSKATILAGLDGPSDAEGHWTIQLDTSDRDHLDVDAQVRGVLLGILENHESL